MTPVRIAILGYGKIARDQHIPAIRKSPDFTLVAVVSSSLARHDDVPVFRTLDDLIAGNTAFDALAICTPPTIRTEPALSAMRSGKHVMLEKPPGLSLDEVTRMADVAHENDVTLMTSWHSRHAAAVAQAKSLLQARTITAINIDWREDVAKWHPGQDWIWQKGGMGVFDPGINALSILTELVQDEFSVLKADLTFEQGHVMPIAAQLVLNSKAGLTVTAHFDWRPIETDVWSLDISTTDGGVTLSDGGNKLLVDKVPASVASAETEYDAVYNQLAASIASKCVAVDMEPLRLVLDALAQHDAVDRSRNTH